MSNLAKPQSSKFATAKAKLSTSKTPTKATPAKKSAKRLQVLVTPEEHAEIKAAAAKKGMSITALLEQAVKNILK